jgi:geranylgeranyl diphosphate synthase type II
MTDLAAAKILDYTARWRNAVEAEISRAIGVGEPAVLYEAMRYSALGPGKRLRPLVVLAACEACGAAPEAALPAAAAIELVHAFSLVHDDLPCMDDDDYRRGRPTCHKVYGEAIALLAGDALVARGVGYLAEIPDTWAKAAAGVLAGAVAGGMVPGQVLDMLAEAGEEVDVVQLHRQKTGTLFVAAARMGAHAAGADIDTVMTLSRFGGHLGLAFQIADDVLDAGEGSGDQAKGKATYPARFGLESARQMARVEAERALGALSGFGPAADTLRAVARFAVERDR